MTPADLLADSLATRCIAIAAALVLGAFLWHHLSRLWDRYGDEAMAWVDWRLARPAPPKDREGWEHYRQRLAVWRANKPMPRMVRR